MTAYSVSQFLKYRGNHDVSIIVGDNNPGDGTIEYLKPFEKDILIVNYPKDKLQSHGILIDYVLSLGFVKTSHFITAESDAFPVREGYLDYYEKAINDGYDLGGSRLLLSGGDYLHPCGSFYSVKIWQECKEYVDTIEYEYFPNMSMRENFQAHLMVHHSILDKFLENPENYIELADGYKPYTKEKALERLEYYRPVGDGIFHNGMGGRNESIKTYGDRSLSSETPFAVLTSKSQKMVNRIGLEPGQFIHYWANAVGKKIFYVPIEVVWVPGREHENQEYTLMESGIKHIWGVSSYRDSDPTNNDWIKRKQIAPLELYETLPEHQKIKE